MIALLSSILGILSAIVPSLIRLLEKRMEYKFEIQLFQLKIEAATKGLEFAAHVEDIRSIVAEGDSLRRHDLLLSGGEFIDTLRASIRPVITYTLFSLFLLTKVVLLVIAIMAGTNLPDVAKLVFDDHTVALFATIMGFWFGTRAMTKMEELYASSGKMNSGNFKPQKK